MKVTRPSLNIFLSELSKLPKAIENVETAAEEWTKQQEDRENGYHDQWWTKMKRDKLEQRLIELREVLAKVYDEQGDRGLF